MFGRGTWLEGVLKALQGKSPRPQSFADLCITSPGFKLKTGPPEKFLSGNSIKLNDLIDTLIQLRSYYAQCLEYNHIVEQRARGLPWEQLRQLEDIGYLDKLSLVRCALDTNEFLIGQIIASTIEGLVRDNTINGSTEYISEITHVCRMFGFELGEGADKVLVTYKGGGHHIDHLVPGCDPYRVSEAISHLGRDYSPEFADEVAPLFEYVQKTLKTDILQEGSNLSSSDLIVVPGAGTGYISLKLAETFPETTVESIELSMLMYLCNQFILSDSKSTLKVCPFATHYSSQLDLLNQIREIEFQHQQRPTNLNVLCGDFTDYISSRHNRIVVVTVYFMDTAENIFDYMDSIERLSKCGQELHWINVGPLKYGTKPKVQLTANEFRELRKIRGWEDINVSDSGETDDPLNGYLTDKRALYQGFYRLVKFHSVYRKTTHNSVGDKT